MIQFRAEERDKAIAIENKNAMIAAKEQELAMMQQRLREMDHELQSAHQFKNTMEEAGLIKVDQQSQIIAVLDPAE